MRSCPLSSRASVVMRAMSIPGSMAEQLKCMFDAMHAFSKRAADGRDHRGHGELTGLRNRMPQSK